MTAKKITIISIIVSLLIITAAYIFSFPMKKATFKNENLIEFNEDGFIDAQKVEINNNGERIYTDVLTNKNKKVSENQNLILYLDETTTHFVLEDKLSGKKWLSNPENPTTDSQKSTITINYLERQGSLNTVKSINNYKLSINHEATIDYDQDGRKTYSVKYIDSGFQILYKMKSLELNYLSIPRFLTDDVYKVVLKELESRLDENPESTLDLLFKNIYTKDTNDPTKRQIIQSRYENMSSSELSSLYEIFYPIDEKNKIPILGDYSIERVEQENQENGYYTSFTEFFFEVAIQVKLTNNGVETTVIKNSIKESADHKINEISLYPMFGAENRDLNNLDRGYLVVPDGSGAVINFDNGKGGETNAYKRRIYGQDLALLPSQKVDRENLIFPLFGLVTNNTGFAAVITEGEAMAYINANVSSERNPFNTINTSFALREIETITIGSSISAYTVILATNDIVNTDFSVKYYLLDNNTNSYSGIASMYKQYLIDEYGLEIKDNTTNPKLTLELLGAFDRKKFALGVPYTKQESLTTFKQANIIINEFIEKNINDINILYNGAINGGLSQNIANKTKIEKALGGKKEFMKLEKTLDNKGIDIFVTTKIAGVSDYTRPFDQYRYTSRRLSGDNANILEYNQATNIKNDGNHDYTLNPRYYDSLYKKFNKKNLLQNLSFEYIGSELAGSYAKKDVIYKQDALLLQKQMLEKVDKKLMSSEPLGFAIKYMDYIVDLSTKTTNYTIVDYEIPLNQLVLSGLIDYTTQSINLTASRSIDYQFMKALETGSNLKYTLSYESSEILLNTQYNDYLSTYYKNWEEIIQSHYNKMKDANIHGGKLINHQRLANNVNKSIFSNGVEIVFNYNPYPVTINGKTIDGLDYFIGVI